MRRVATGTVQAAYYAASGLWPVVSYRSFEATTGRKREPWLVKTVGLLLVVTASAVAADPRGESRSTRLVGIGSAAALGMIDVWYAAVRRRISPIYLADACAELAIVTAWLRQRRNPPHG
jgi:hypothetical protein